MTKPDASIIVESYNHAEGASGLERLRMALVDLAGMVRALAPGGRTSEVGLKAVDA